MISELVRRVDDECIAGRVSVPRTIHESGYRSVGTGPSNQTDGSYKELRNASGLPNPAGAKAWAPNARRRQEAGRRELVESDRCPKSSANLKTAFRKLTLKGDFQSGFLHEK